MDNQRHRTNSHREHRQRSFPQFISLVRTTHPSLSLHLCALASSSRLSHSTGYSSGSSSSSMDSHSTILSAYSSRSNSSLSERSKTSPPPLKPLAIQPLPTISETELPPTKRRKTVSLEVRLSLSLHAFVDLFSSE